MIHGSCPMHADGGSKDVEDAAEKPYHTEMTQVPCITLNRSSELLLRTGCIKGCVRATDTITSWQRYCRLNYNCFMVHVEQKQYVKWTGLHKSASCLSPRKVSRFVYCFGVTAHCSDINSVSSCCTRLEKHCNAHDDSKPMKMVKQHVNCAATVHKVSQSSTTM